MALAEGQPNPSSEGTTQQQPMMKDKNAGSQNQSPAIDHSQLNRDQIRRIQRGLNKAGFDAKGVDGIWGNNTREALRSYQQEKNLPGNGDLNQQTLAALGVQFADQGAAGARGGTSATGEGTGESGSRATPNADPDTNNSKQ
ncbi:MAG: peptidoglycan-binding protein [Hyphomicrobiaceae bacterium]